MSSGAHSPFITKAAEANTANASEDLFKRGKECELKGSKQEAIGYYTQFLLSPEGDLGLKEQVAIWVGKAADIAQLAAFIRTLEPALLQFPRAKTARILKQLLDLFPVESPDLITLLGELIKWCQEDRRVYLLQQLQIRLAQVQAAHGHTTLALQLLSDLARQLRKVDDKVGLVEVHLLEAKTLFQVRAMAKAKAALTAARTCANAVYCPTEWVADLDLLAGMVYGEDGEYRTAVSYFIESLEGFALAPESALATNGGSKALRYLALAKVMMAEKEAVSEQKSPDAVFLKSTIEMKAAKPFYPKEPDYLAALDRVGWAVKSGSLQAFDAVMTESRSVLGVDEYVCDHLGRLLDGMLARNLQLLIRPFSHVPLGYLAEKCQLNAAQIEAKVCQMILDGKLAGVIDQDMVVVDPDAASLNVDDPVYTAAITAVRSLKRVVDGLEEKAMKRGIY